MSPCVGYMEARRKLDMTYRDPFLPAQSYPKKLDTLGERHPPPPPPPPPPIPPYTLRLQCPSFSKVSQLSYEPGCSHELWCRNALHSFETSMFYFF